MSYRLDQNLEDAIYDWTVSCLNDSNIVVIWDKSDEIRPEKPYCTLNVISGPYNINTRGEYKYKELDTFTYTFVKRFTLSINIYADDYSSKKIDDILNGTILETKLQILNNSGLAIHGTNGPNDISIPIISEYEFRSQLDVFMSYGKIIDDVTGEIQSVELNSRIIE